jgi:hypothetical protein
MAALAKAASSGLPIAKGYTASRVGKWRIFFDLDSPYAVRIHGIDNRGETY